jgi:hypothetical protein
MGVSPFIFPNEFFQIEELGLFFKSVLAMIGGRNRVGLYRYFTLNVISYSGQSLATQVRLRTTSWQQRQAISLARTGKALRMAERSWGPAALDCRERAVLVALGLAFRPILLRLSDIGIQSSLANRKPGPGHEVLIIGEVDFGQAHHRKDFA